MLSPHTMSLSWPGGLSALLRQAGAFDLLDSAVAILDASGTLVYQNPAFARFNGETRDSLEAFGRADSLFESSAVRARVEECLQSSTVVSMVQPLYLGRAMKADLTLILRPVRNQDDGALVGALISIAEESVQHEERHLLRLQHSTRELAKRVRALSEDKRESEQTIRALLRDSPFPMILFNRNRQVVSMNQASGRLLGVSPREGIGQSCERFFDCFRVNGCCPLLQQGREIKLEECNAITHKHENVIVLRSAVALSGTAEPVILEAFIDLTESKRQEDTLARLGRILDDSSNEIYVFSTETLRFVQANRGARQNLGYDMDELRSLTPLDLKPEYTQEGFEALIAPLRDGAQDQITFKTVHRRKNGTMYPVEVRLQLSRSERKPVFVAIIQDISERDLLAAEMDKLSSALQQTADAIIITDRNGLIEYVNPAFETTTGYPRDQALGRTTSIIKSDKHDRAFFERLWQTILSGESFRDVLVNRKQDGTLYYEEKTITPLKDVQGRITHFISTGKDITERMQTQERLQYLAYHDMLTELPNRALLCERLEHSLARARWTKRLLAVLFLDLDRFKIINDTLGHEVGDRLLQSLASRLRECVREGDTVARLSGDEFAILLEDIAAANDVAAVASKILDACTRPFELAGRELFVTISIGVSIHPDDGDDVASLLRNADTAMYRAKEQGRNSYQFYSADMGAKAIERLTLETGLRHALERREFVLHFQPQVELASGQITGAEALLRWQHPELGLVQPGDFIPLLEDTGLIVPVGGWVVEAVCRQLKHWRGLTSRALRMTVNLSARQFSETELVSRISQTVRQHEIDPTELELEITESIIMGNASESIKTLNALSDMGFRFAIDDFGTGYSSLSYLKRFAINTLKIDRSFVRDIPGDPDDSAIVTTIVAMAHNLKLEVIAEGVETNEQLAFLRACGCDGYQGYLFSRPVPAEDFTRLLQESSRGKS